MECLPAGYLCGENVTARPQAAWLSPSKLRPRTVRFATNETLRHFAVPLPVERRCAILSLVELDPELENVLPQLFAACDVFQIAPRLVGGALRGYTP